MGGAHPPRRPRRRSATTPTSDGDAGAEKAAAIIGGRTVRVRPPLDGGDWCDWKGGREEFLELVKAPTSSAPLRVSTALRASSRIEYPKAEPLLGEPGAIFLARGSLLMVYGADGAGKSTWTIDGIAHLAAGVPWLGIPVPRPVRVCIIENEGPPALFQQKLAAKIAELGGPRPGAQPLRASRGPWGEFSFADPDARAALVEFCEEHAIDVVTANPTLGLGVAASGRPDETQQFVDWLVECGLKSTRAFWLLPPREQGRPDLAATGAATPTRRCSSSKTATSRARSSTGRRRAGRRSRARRSRRRACSSGSSRRRATRSTELDTVGASDAELEERLADFLAEHPWSTTRAVWEGVNGTNERIRRLLEGDRFDCVGGPRNSILWGLAKETDSTASEEPTQSPNQPMEIGMNKRID